MCLKIGILIENSDPFKSGAIQQSLYIYDVLKLSGIDVNFYCNDKSYKHFGQPYMKDIEVIYCDKQSVINLDIMIYLSAYFKTEDSKILKTLNIKIVQLLCGNNYMFNQEKLIFPNTHKNVHSFNNEYIDEYWLLPMYTHAKSYIETHSKKPVKIMPYIWNTTFLDIWINNNKDISFTLSNNINVLVCEPNVNITKTALVPLMISEKNNELIDKIYCLCLEHRKEGFDDIFENKLEITKKNKLEIYNRLKLYNVLLQLKEKNKCPFIISHQLLNDLNFLHLELFYLGYPVIHNCNRLKECGYFYKNHNIDNGSEVFIKAVENHIYNYKTKRYKDNVKKLLFKFSPKNKKNQQKYLSESLKLVGKTEIPAILSYNKIPTFIYKYGKLSHNKKKSKEMYRVKYYDYNKIHTFFMTEYSKEHLNIYNYINDDKVKTQFWIICILNIYGGIYIDEENYDYNKLEKIIEEDDNFICGIYENKIDLRYIMSKKNMKILHFCILKYLYMYKSGVEYSYEVWKLENIFELNVNSRLDKDNIVYKENIKYKFNVLCKDIFIPKINISNNNVIKIPSLIVCPTEGFGNRMRMLASSYIYSKYLGIKLLVNWVKTDVCNIDLDDIFIKDTFNVINTDDIKKFKYVYFGRVHTSTLFEKIDNIVKNNTELDYIVLEGGHEFCHTSITNFVEEKHKFYKNLSFLDKYNNIDLEYKWEDFDNKEYTTIHYRDYNEKYDKIDNATFVQDSPLYNFFSLIRKLVDITTPLIICSNNIEIENIFQKELNEYNIIPNKYNKGGDRSNVNSMENAIYNFLMMSKSKSIIGTYYSSFSDESTYINYIPKYIPINNKKTNNKLEYHCCNIEYSHDKEYLILNNKNFNNL